MRLTAADYEGLLDNENVQRALATLRATEGTAKAANPYAVGFGFSQIDDLSQHPGTSRAFTQTDGRRNRTTAAGAYQHLGRTWESQRTQLGLPDFSPRSQDIAAVALIDQAGALGNVLKGDVRGFANKVGGTWASLPSSPYAQPKKSMSFVENAWNSYKAAPVTGPTPKANPYGLLSTRDVVAASSPPAGLLSSGITTKGARVGGSLVPTKEVDSVSPVANVPTPKSREAALLQTTLTDRFAGGRPLSAGFDQGTLPQSVIDRYAATRPGTGSRVAPTQIAGLSRQQEANLADRLGTFEPTRQVQPSRAAQLGQVAAGLLGVSPAAASELPAGARVQTSGFAGAVGSPRSMESRLPAGALGGLLGQTNVPTPTFADRPAPITTSRVVADAPRVATPQRTAVASPVAAGAYSGLRNPAQAAQTNYAPQEAPSATPTQPKPERSWQQKAAVVAGGLLGGAVAGPIGGILGGAIANTAVNRGLLSSTQRTTPQSNGGYATNLPERPDAPTVAQKRELERSLAERRSGGEGPSMSRETRDSIRSGKAGGGLF